MIWNQTKKKFQTPNFDVYRYCVKSYVGHREWVRMVRVNPNGSVFATCSNDHAIRVWCLNSKECKVCVQKNLIFPIVTNEINFYFKVELRDHDHTVECIAWAPDTASASINEAAGVDNKKGAHQGPFLASGSRDKSIRVTFC